MKVKPNKDDPYSRYLKIIFGDNFVIRLRSGLIVVGGRKILGIFVPTSSICAKKFNLALIKVQ